MPKFTVAKQYRDFPAAHRQPNHDGHCRFIHGHNWGFDIVFAAEELDNNGFVVDVGKLGEVKDFLKTHFDHTLLLNQNDPHLRFFQANLQNSPTVFAQIVSVPNCGMEGLAKFVCDWVNAWAAGNEERKGRGLRAVSVTCWEDSKNSATYTPSL